MPITYQQIARWHDQLQMHVHQNFYEFCGWLNRLEGLQPRTYIEIGTYFFGTAQLALEALPSVERLVTIDVIDRLHQKDFQQRLQRYAGRLEFVQGDTRSLDTRTRVSDMIEGEADCLFIDGDHQFNSVASDFTLYAALVRPGGLIGFHDVRMQGVGQGGEHLGSKVFWQGLETCYPRQTEIIDTEPGPWGNYGIGVYRRV